MGGKAGFVPLCIDGAAGGRCEHFRLAPVGTGAMCAGCRFGTCSSEQVDMVGGLARWAGSYELQSVWVQTGCVRVQPCSIARFGVSCRERRERIAGQQWPVVSGQWSVVGGRGLKGAGIAWLLGEGWGSVLQFWTAPSLQGDCIYIGSEHRNAAEFTSG